MKATVYSLEGKKVKEIELPKVFETEFHPEVIKRAVLAIQTAKLQPKGIKPNAGRDTSAEARSSRQLPFMERTINVGRARLPRTKDRRYLLQGRVAKVPQAVGGPRAHPPKVEKKIVEKINKKEKILALKSAIAATAKEEIVRSRHEINSKIELPIIVESKFEKLSKTKDVLNVLEKLGLANEIEEAKKKKKIRAGKGKRRGRRYKRKKSLLIVTSDPKAAIRNAAENLEGVDVQYVKFLNAKLLAPGTKAGRLTVWSENAIKMLGELYG
ncbi:MAG: 50S ribosomal protein L4 [Candidatus Diapherotrites archaeon]|nr:50S ribosomal protein L4 [Candidatus Diapherotrites archaeon]